MIDPVRITNFKSTKKDLEEVLLFWICAAGKTAKIASRALDAFLIAQKIRKSPFEIIRQIGRRRLPGLLKKYGIGCYNQKARTMWELVSSKLNLKKCSIDELEAIYGIGRKTARCFALHTRKNARCAGLDTHVLKYLRDKGYDAPKQTPSSKKKYLELEEAFIAEADKEMPRKPIAVFDLAIWKKYSGNN